MLPAIRAGMEVAPTPELAARLEAALKLVDHLDAETLAVASDRGLGDAERVVERATPSSLVSAVAAHLGLERALGMMVAAESVHLDAASGGWMTAVWLAEGPHRFRNARPLAWQALRHAVCAASSQAYVSAVEWVQTHRSSDPVVRRRLAATFPDEPWADEQLAEILSGATPDEEAVSELLVSCSRPVSAEVLARVPNHARLLSDAASDLAARWPADDIVPLLAASMAALLQKPKYGPLHKTPPRRIAEALTEIGDARCAEVMASYLGHRILGPQAVRFFETHPEHRDHVASRDPGLHRRLMPTAEVVTCAEDAVPALLRDRGWRPARHAEAVVEGLVWPHAVEGTYVAAAPPSRRASKARPMTEDELEAWRSASFRYCDGQRVPVRGGPPEVLEVPAEEGLAAWNAGSGYVFDELSWAARHGVAALPGFMASDWTRYLHEDYGRHRLAVLSSMRTPEVVPCFVEMLHRKRWRATALRWLLAHPRTAAIALVPMALGPKARKQGQAALLALADGGAAEELEEVARGYGAAAETAVRNFLARPRSLPGKPPKLPEWLQIDALPAPRVASGALPLDAVAALVELLSLDPSAHGYVVKLELEPSSVSDFVEALLETWADHDAPGQQDWILRAALVFEVPAPRRRVAELFRGWAHRAKAKALRCIPVLEALGDERALLALTQAAHGSRIQAVKAAAQEGLERIAADRGWSREELDDRTVPSLGLDGRGGVELGHRGMRAQVSSELTVELHDAEGALVRALPRAGDDPEAHARAKRRLAELRSDVAALATRQRQRLEAAMVAQRSWPLAEARRWLFEAPLLAGVVRALVWVCEGVAFRVSEDGTFADVRDEPIDFDEGRVCVAHPLHLSDLSTWADLWADYALLQPFAQLGRPTYRRGEVGRSEVELSRVGPVPGVKAMGRLEARGWTREGDGWRRGEARIMAEPGIDFAYLDGQEVYLVAGPTECLDEIAFSELAHDLRSWE